MYIIKRSTAYAANTSFFFLCKGSISQPQGGSVSEGLALVRYRQFFSAFSATCSQHFSAVGGRHSLTKSVLICSFSA